ncbi:MAG: cupin domain-containing protein [Caldilineaceae bacterium]|nr:cupin domain-containing protein [Caldilineaceae bacterium]
MPIRPGFTIENPITHTRVTVLEMNDQGWLLEHHFPPEAPPDIPEHLHLTWTETFEILAGEAQYKLNGKTQTAHAGEIIQLMPGQPHIHPWNAGQTALIYRQRDDFGRAEPRAAQDVLGVFATNAGLTRDGKSDKTGQPRDPLQVAVALKMLGSYGGYDTRIPIPVQKFLGATLGTLGEWLGYRAVIDSYVN